MGNAAPMSHLRLTPEEFARLQARKTNRAGEVVEKPKRAAKYGNVKTGDADSAKESRRSAELALLQKAGEIRDLRHQVPYAMVHNGVLICQYVADHVYVDSASNATVVEDTKSPPTRKNQVYVLKRKMMLAFHGINIRET